MNDLWDRQKGESGQAYEAFKVFRDLGITRTVRRVSEILSKSQTLIKGWKAKWDWEARARAYDEELEKQAMIAKTEAIQEMNERHVREAKSLQAKALQALSAVDISKLRPRDILRFITEAAKLERIAMGEPDSIEEIRQKEELGEVDEYIEKLVTDPRVLEAIQGATLALAEGSDSGSEAGSVDKGDIEE